MIGVGYKPHDDGRKMTRVEAEDFIYSSYMRAVPHLSYDLPDSRKRHPEYTADIIRGLYRSGASVAVTGSKGKGSVAYILSMILSCHGKTGLMTGPHIESFNERFRMDGVPIGDEEFTDIVSGLAAEFDRIQNGVEPDRGEFISPIGIETAIAETWFARSGTAYDIFECGKGVEYDDVGNIPADYGIINSIFLEHVRELGDNVETIARDKSRIIRSGMKGVYSGVQDDGVAEIIKARADEFGVPLRLYGRDFAAENISYGDGFMACDVVTGRRRYENLRLSLMGSHQRRNLAIAIAVAEDMVGGDFCATSQVEAKVRDALMGLDWFGRLSLIRRDPVLLVDCCINRQSVDGAMEAVSELGISDAVFVMAIPDDKDYFGVASRVHEAGHGIVLTKVGNPHYRFALEGGFSKQQKVLKELGIDCGYAESLAEAIDGLKGAGVVLGTTAMLSEIMRYKETYSNSGT